MRLFCAPKRDEAGLFIARQSAIVDGMQDYRLFDHTADIGVEMMADTRKTLFQNAVLTVCQIMLETSSHPLGLSHNSEKELVVEGQDLDDLFFNFLREILYLLCGERWVPLTCEISKIHQKSITARLTGRPLNPNLDIIQNDIKAVTYSGLKVVREGRKWKARVIFDV